MMPEAGRGATGGGGGGGGGGDGAMPHLHRQARVLLESLAAESAVVPQTALLASKPHMAALAFSWLAGMGSRIQLMSCVMVTCSRAGRTK